MINIKFENQNFNNNVNSLGYNEYYIAFLDILGFKYIVKHYSKEEVHTFFDIINNDVKNSKSHFPMLLRDGCFLIPSPTCEVGCHIMSDSIILYIEANRLNPLSALIHRCKEIVIKLLLTKSIVIRGGISKGGLCFENNVIFGPGLVDAYMLQEKIADVPRIVISEDAYRNVGSDDLIFIKATNLIYIDDYSGAKYKCVNYMDVNTEIKNKIVDLVIKKLSVYKDENIRKKYSYIYNNMKRDTK